MSIVIVTPVQYLVASKIHHVTLDENSSTNDLYVGGKSFNLPNRNFTITITYTPDITNPHGQSYSSDTRNCEVIVTGAVHAQTLFKELIEQIREQIPDQVYLDKALERMLSTMDIEGAKQIDIRDRHEKEYISKEIFNAIKRVTTKVSKPRKAKRNRKKVLRRPKKRNRRSAR